MRNRLRSKPVLVMATVLLTAAVAISFSIAGISSTRAASPTTFTGPSHFNAKGGLDCNGYSATGQKPLLNPLACTDLNGVSSGEGYSGRGEDNGHYIGHDEPSTQFNSNESGSGNNVRYTVVLPREEPLPATQTFENMPAFWFSMALCDPGSFPQHPCTPDSDTNNPSVAGSAFLEMQFYPPGFAPFITQISCDRTHWCASLHINSLECITIAGVVKCNPNCLETTNFAFIQMDGIPTGPPGPNTMTAASATPNAETLLMNQGDRLRITIKDTPGNTTGGVTTIINDLSTGKSGFMIASAANGFQSLNVSTCAGTNFSFHPEYSSAKFGNAVPWAALQANVGFAVETGHFELGAKGDSDADDPPCFPATSISILAGCVDLATGGDLDFDGTSYQRDWPDRTEHNASSVRFTSPLSAPFGSSEYHDRYPIMQIETDIPASESTCAPTGIGCTVPPPGAKFYPFYSVTRGEDARSAGDEGCVFLFGNNRRGVNDLGEDSQYGTPYLPWFFGTSSSGPEDNPCL